MKIMNTFDGEWSHSTSLKESYLECGVRDINMKHLTERPPDNVRWVHKQESFNEDGDNTGITIFTDKFLLPQMKDWYSSINSPYKIGILLESISITPRIYTDIIEIEDSFDFIFTYSESLLSRNPKKYKFIPGGWVCVEEESHKPHKKTKMTSIIYSEKSGGGPESELDARHIRHQVAERFGKLKIDVFGSGSPKGEEPIKSKTLNDYRFSVVIENTISSETTYYSEKILDCFLTKNVPIYRGTSNITKFFDERGIIQWTELDELEEILDSLSEEMYEEMKPYMEKNYNLAQKYISPDDVIYELIKKCQSNIDYDTRHFFKTKV